MCCTANEQTAREPELVDYPIFGADEAAYYLRLEKPTRQIVIGAASEVDTVLVATRELGRVVISPERPLVSHVPITGISIRPFRTRGTDVTKLAKIYYQARLQLVSSLELSPWLPTHRSPRRYSLSAVTGAAEVAVTRTLDDDLASVGVGVPTFGAANISFGIRNPSAAGTIRYRLVGVKFVNGSPYEFEYPIDPLGYPTTAPTYTTVPASSRVMNHIGVDRYDFLRLYVIDGTAAGVTVQIDFEVADR